MLKYTYISLRARLNLNLLTILWASSYGGGKYGGGGVGGGGGEGAGDCGDERGLGEDGGIAIASS